MTNLHSPTRFAQLTALCLLVLATTSIQAQTRYAVSADGQEVLDTQTNLLWRRCAEGMQWNGKICKGKPAKFKFSGAKQAADKLAKATDKAWRVPSRDELNGILVKMKKKPMIDATAFPNTPAALFLASRPGFDDNLNAWLVHFGNRRTYGYTGQSRFYLRLVRTKP
jgi:hypothetical protein